MDFVLWLAHHDWFERYEDFASGGVSASDCRLAISIFRPKMRHHPRGAGLYGHPLVLRPRVGSRLGVTRPRLFIPRLIAILPVCFSSAADERRGLKRAIFSSDSHVDRTSTASTSG